MDDCEIVPVSDERLLEQASTALLMLYSAGTALLAQTPQPEPQEDVLQLECRRAATSA